MQIPAAVSNLFVVQPTPSARGAERKRSTPRTHVQIQIEVDALNAADCIPHRHIVAWTVTLALIRVEVHLWCRLRFPGVTLQFAPPSPISDRSNQSVHWPLRAAGAVFLTELYFSSTIRISSGIFSSESERSDSLSRYSMSLKRSATHCAVSRASGSWSQHSSMEAHTIWMPCSGGAAAPTCHRSITQSRGRGRQTEYHHRGACFRAPVQNRSSWRATRPPAATGLLPNDVTAV
ncbi:hypothetical protein EYF80_059059 [Liparis tanakae]|uniref:Uncharacterized protein n=1 Tax=Liparis tanakae TaxID=230148 RepID=A0A4Z2EPP6_9TELE|nr:hypothetical protein EYF80_059059 [Liparis tanakae]